VFLYYCAIYLTTKDEYIKRQRTLTSLKENFGCRLEAIDVNAVASFGVIHQLLAVWKYQLAACLHQMDTISILTDDGLEHSREYAYELSTE